MNRHLIEAAAEALDNGVDPFSDPFRTERQVSPADSGVLAGLCAAGLRLLLFVRENPDLIGYGTLEDADLYRMATLLSQITGPEPG